MMALIVDGKVAQVAAQSFQVADAWFWVECPDNCQYGWLYENGVLSPPPVPQPSTDEIIAQYSAGIQIYIDGVAQAKSYDSALYCASYASSTVTQWKNEADTFISWRDAVWTYVLAQLPLFQNGTRPLIPLPQFITEFPVIVWPD